VKELLERETSLITCQTDLSLSLYLYLSLSISHTHTHTQSWPKCMASVQ